MSRLLVADAAVIANCPTCGIAFRLDLRDDSAGPEWLLPAEFAAAEGTTLAAAYAQIERHRVPGVLHIGRSILVNRFRVSVGGGWCAAAGSPTRIPARTEEVPCPVCATPVAVNATAVQPVGRDRMRRYVRACTPGAFNKRVQRGQLPAPLPMSGPRRWDPLDVQRRLRVAMFVREFGIRRETS